ncbi:hypothetical protein [Shewanella sp. AS1]|uniref:hypothetical protein n=1 Tax=Shewanella sp. AS1 TaxID=2907626 RepID=UPI001F30DF11|nr:hypothetical protein [Shewanella sp. AS1]
MYLYKRAQRLAKEEQRQAQRAAEKLVPLEDEVVSSTKTQSESLAEPEAPVPVRPISIGPDAEIEQEAEIESEIESTPVVASVSESSESAMDESWANDKLASALIEYRNAATAEEKHAGLLQAIGECYKQRKEQSYCEYGAGLAADYQAVFAQLPSPANEKGTAFMQLATLLNDSGQFDGAIKVCQTAMGYGLTDGTVTGFEGRIARIEKAKQKVAK